MSRSILVTGATGKQGGSVVAALLAADANFRILALTRDASSPAAKKLASTSKDITVVEGNLDDVKSIFDSARKVASGPIWGVFSVQAPAFNKTGPQIEETQGKALIDAALQNDVQRFVYSSVDRGGPGRSDQNPTDIPHFRSKHNIEQHLFKQTTKSTTTPSPMTWTVLRPVAFMENFDGGFVGKIFASCWHLVLGPNKKPLQLVATSDIGVFAARAFVAPEGDPFYSKKSISLAGDELTYDQMAKIFKRETGGKEVPRTLGIMARMTLWMSEEMGTMFGFFGREGYGANIGELRKREEGMGMKSFGSWLREESGFVKRG